MQTVLEAKLAAKAISAGKGSRSDKRIAGALSGNHYISKCPVIMATRFQMVTNRENRARRRSGTQVRRSVQRDGGLDRVKSKRLPFAGDEGVSPGSQDLGARSARVRTTPGSHARAGSAFLGGDGEKGGGFLMDALAATLGAFHFVLVVFLESEDDFKGLSAIFAVELIARHGDLQKTPERWALPKGVRPGEGGVKGSGPVEIELA